MATRTELKMKSDWLVTARTLINLHVHDLSRLIRFNTDHIVPDCSTNKSHGLTQITLSYQTFLPASYTKYTEDLPWYSFKSVCSLDSEDRFSTVEFGERSTRRVGVENGLVYDVQVSQWSLCVEHAKLPQLTWTYLFCQPPWLNLRHADTSFIILTPYMVINIRHALRSWQFGIFDEYSYAIISSRL